MIKAGRIVCFHCVSEVKEPYYYIPQERLVLEASKNRFGDFKIEDVNKKIKVELEQKPETKNGLLLKAKIRVRFEDGKTRSFMITNENRICPECYNSDKVIHYLPATMGYVDTYVIGVLGRPSVGKSSWIDSACRVLTLDNDSHMHLSNKNIPEVVTYKANPMDDRKDLVHEVMITNSRGIPCAEVLINDTPGEYITKSREERGADHEYFKRYIDLCDGLVYVLAAGDDNIQDLDWVTFISEKTPVAIVMSKADKLAGQLSGGVLEKDGMAFLTQDYFAKRKNGEQISEHDMVVNQVVDKQIVRKMCPALSRIDSKRDHVGYFAVSAGVPVGSDETTLDLKNAMNVYAPIMFLVKYLGMR